MREEQLSPEAIIADGDPRVREAHYARQTARVSRWEKKAVAAIARGICQTFKEAKIKK